MAFDGPLVPVRGCLRSDHKDANGTCQVDWFRALDGVKQSAGPLEGGADRGEFTE
jgi:hypothetical protein